jgi:hypothetical protein
MKNKYRILLYSTNKKSMSLAISKIYIQIKINHDLTIVMVYLFLNLQQKINNIKIIPLWH